MHLLINNEAEKIVSGRSKPQKSPLAQIQTPKQPQQPAQPQRQQQPAQSQQQQQQQQSHKQQQSPQQIINAIVDNAYARRGPELVCNES